MHSNQDQVTQLLKAMVGGDNTAAELLLPLVYAELHSLATSSMQGKPIGPLLESTSWIEGAAATDREQIIGVAAGVMRRVVVDNARAKQPGHRAGAVLRKDPGSGVTLSPNKLDEVLLVDDAIQQLEQENPRRARVATLRYFGGLSLEQIASLLQAEPLSIKRDWTLARIWLFRALQPSSTIAGL